MSGSTETQHVQINIFLFFFSHLDPVALVLKGRCDEFKRVRLFPSTGEQGAGAGEPAGSGALVQSAGSRGGGGEDHPGLAGSDRRPGTHQLHQLRRSETGALVWLLSLGVGMLIGAACGEVCPSVCVSSLFISADYLASRCQASLDCMDRLHSTREAFLTDSTGETIQISFVRDA